MRKDVLSILLSASLVFTMAPVGGTVKASAANGENSKASVSVEAVKKTAAKQKTDAVRKSDEAAKAEGDFGGTKGDDGNWQNPTHHWSLSEDGVLTISGEGDMPDFTEKAEGTAYTTAPWYEHRYDINKIVFTGNVSKVGNYSFYKEYQSVTEVDFSAAEKLTVIGDYSFAGTSDMTSKIATLTGTDHITTVNQYAFAYNDTIESLSFAGLTTQGGMYPFYYCTAVTSVDMPKLQNLQMGTFAYCTSLTDVKLPGITEIPDKAYTFSNCTSLENITLEHVTQITTSVQTTCMFSDCSALREVHFPELTDLKGSYSIFKNCSSIETIDMPLLATVVGNGCFANLPKLKTVELPALKKAGNTLFQNCTSLESASLPLVESGGSSLMEVNVPKLQVNKEVAGVAMFSNCTSLVWVRLPGVTDTFTPKQSWDAKDTLFTGCNSLQRIYLEGTMTGDASKTFSFGDITPTIYVATAEDKEQLATYKEGNDEKIKVVTDTPEKTFDALVAKENKLRIAMKDYDAENASDPASNPTVTLNEKEDSSVTYKYYTDAAGTTLVDGGNPSKLPEKAGHYYVRGYTAGNDNCFATSSNIVPFTVFGEITADGYKYNNKTGLLTITNKELVTKDYATESAVSWKDYKSEIKEIKLEFEGVESLEKVGNMAFRNLPELTTFDLPDSVTTVGNYAFEQCRKWTEEVNLTLTAVGEGAFAYCNQLSGTVTLTSDVTEVKKKTFQQTLLSSITVPDEVQTFGESCFDGCSELQKINIPNGVTELPNRFMADCKKVTEVTLPESVVTLGEYSLSRVGMETIDISHVTTLKTAAFYECPNLKTVEIPEAITQIPSYLFTGSGLEHIVIPETVTNIAKGDIFGRCEKLTYVEFENDEYTKATFPEARNSKADILFINTPKDLVVICNGNTYDLLKEYANGTTGDNGTDWTADILYKPNEIETLYTADKTAADSLNQEDYSEGLWTKYLEEKQKADETAGTGATNYEKTVNYLKARNILREAVKKFLDSTYQSMQSVQQDDYFYFEISTDEEAQLWDDFESARETAASMLEDSISNVSVQEYVNAEKELRETREALVPVPTDDALGELDTALETVAGLVASDYTEDSWKALQAVVTEVTAQKDEIKDMMFSGVMAALQKVQDALDALEMIPTDDAVAELDSVLQSVDQLNSTDYTEESWNALQTALEEARQAKENGTVSQIEAAQKKVEDAIAALATPSVETEAPSQEPGTQTEAPSQEPGTETEAPSQEPGTQTEAPSQEPGTQTEAPSQEPGTQTAAPSDQPGTQQTAAPSGQPGTQTAAPTDQPGTQQTAAPDGQATKKPSTDSSNKKVTVKKVTIKKVSSKKKKTMVVQWKKLSGVTGYQIVIGLDKKMKKGKKTVTIKKAKTVKTTIKKLKSKKKYFVKVRAYKTVKGKKHYGSWSKVKTVKVK